MRLHLPLVLLLVALLLFSLIACDRNGADVNVGGGDVVMNPGSSTTTTTTSGSGSGGAEPNKPDEGGVNLPFLPA